MRSNVSKKGMAFVVIMIFTLIFASMPMQKVNAAGKGRTVVKTATNVVYSTPDIFRRRSAAVVGASVYIKNGRVVGIKSAWVTGNGRISKKAIVGRNGVRVVGNTLVSGWPYFSNTGVTHQGIVNIHFNTVLYF